MTTMPAAPIGFNPANAFTLVYDAWNRLVAATGSTTNEYDGLGRRIVHVNVAANPDVTYDHYYNEEWQLLEERKDGSSNPINQFTWHPYYIDALAVRWYDADTDTELAENADGEYYSLQDANFNVTAVTDSGGTVVERYQYSPYGEVTVLDANFAVDGDNLSDIGNTHLYTGRERDPETRLQLNGYRFYAAHLGRWVNRDPIGYWGGMNLYWYVGGMPTYYVDPSGLANFWNPITWGINSPGQSGGSFFNPLNSQYPSTIWGGAQGVGHGAAMIGNAATFHQIGALDSYVDNKIEQYGGLYSAGNAGAHFGAYAGYAATGMWAWGAAGGGQFAVGIGPGTGLTGTHATFGWGTGGAYTWAHVQGGIVTTVWAGPGQWFNITGVPIANPGSVGTWVSGNPQISNCVNAAAQAFGQGFKP